MYIKTLGFGSINDRVGFEDGWGVQTFSNTQFRIPVNQVIYLFHVKIGRQGGKRIYTIGAYVRFTTTRNALLM